ncbi:unnamed protein product [Prorocentrum cordatum]|uniref:Uncharacterized protein n=1 Tax=Prorocentrum cordatum TaxID=2364126 RepID=A0ABN9R320_9DINO|nr:unnamed protein product [Polarella glacialis]
MCTSVLALLPPQPHPRRAAAARGGRRVREGRTVALRDGRVRQGPPLAGRAGGGVGDALGGGPARRRRVERTGGVHGAIPAVGRRAGPAAAGAGASGGRRGRGGLQRGPRRAGGGQEVAAGAEGPRGPDGRISVA